VFEAHPDTHQERTSIVLATLVIGLREGLEAALIVGIIAAFLKRNGRGLGAMWIGVVLAVAASVAVGAALWALESALPQAQQEALETVIGAVAVVFVTGMLFWMNRHARSMKRELETSADAALHDGGALALAVMAFLAVLKEGFETSVFLLATFRAAQSAGLAASGAVLGIAVSAAIGYGIYAGGVRIDLGRFFRITGGFLVLVAAGLVLTAVRTAHEAGWVLAGQQPTIDLGWLAPNGSVQGALITGMLGIPSDPRLIEVVAWLAYVVPVALLVYWPAKHRPSVAGAVRLRWIVAAALGASAIVLALAVPAAPQPSSAARPLAGGGTAALSGATLVVRQGGTVERVPLPAGGSTTRAGAPATLHVATGTAAVRGATTVTLADVTAAAGGRLPVGLDPAQDPGPFTAAWSAKTTTSAWTSGGVLIDARRTAVTVLTVTGGGLTTSRTLTVSGADAPRLAGWHVAPAAVTETADAIVAGTTAGPEHTLWAAEVPIALLIAAAAVALAAVRSRRRSRTAGAAFAPPGASPAPRTRSTPYAVK
jgi:high-affinity iron transporter